MKKPINFLGNIIVIGLTFILYGIVQQFYFYSSRIMRVLHLDIAIYTIVVAVVTVLALWLLFYVYRRQLKKRNDWAFDQKPHWDIRRLLVALLGFVLLIAASAAVQLLLGLGSDSTSTNQSVLNKISPQAGIFYMPMVAFIAPMFEETIFRGLVFNTFFFQKTSSASGPASCSAACSSATSMIRT